jgi:hypothetical protein
MQTVFKQIAAAMVCVVTLYPVQSPAQPPDSAPDLVGTTWKSRAGAATKKLANPGLDRCDKGVELAFQNPNEATSGKQRSFELQIDIDGQAMVASYSYAGQRLNAFVLHALPSGWLAVQKTDSKTLSILVEGSKCSFDLCTNDPFAAGPCAERRTR